MIFTVDDAQFVPKGMYIYQLVIGTGGATFETSQEELPFSAVPLSDGSPAVFTASSKNVIELSDCMFKAGLTGDAELSLLRYSTVYT